VGHHVAAQPLLRIGQQGDGHPGALEAPDPLGGGLPGDGGLELGVHLRPDLGLDEVEELLRDVRQGEDGEAVEHVEGSDEDLR
jgi:hypothetical protein